MEEKVCLAGAPPRAVMNDIMHSCAARRGQRSTEPADPETIVRHRCGLDLAGSGPRACSGSGVPSRIRASCCSASPRLPHRPRRRGHQGIFALRMLLLPPLLRLFGDFDSVLWNPSPPHVSKAWPVAALLLSPARLGCARWQLAEQAERASFVSPARTDALRRECPALPCPAIHNVNWNPPPSTTPFLRFSLPAH